MTLVLNFLSDEYLIQVSDRRLTYPTRRGQAVRVADDSTNKCLLLNYSILASFTGIAKIGKLDTIDWVSQKLISSYNIPLKDRIDLLAKDLGEALSSHGHSKYPLALAFCGWLAFQRERVSQPSIVLLSNFHENLRPSGRIRKKFEVIARPFKNCKFEIVSIGATVPEKIMCELKRLLRHARRSHVSPAFVANRLVDALREIANTDHTVGRKVMVCFLPRTTVEQAGVGGNVVFLNGPKPDFSQSSFFYLGPESDVGIQFGPNVVVGPSGYSEVKAEFSGDGTNHSIQVKML